MATLTCSCATPRSSDRRRRYIPFSLTRLVPTPRSACVHSFRSHAVGPLLSWLKPEDVNFDVLVCNPPFFGSAEE
eukprot:1185744-Prorocentrum_minimum.AAC.1